MAADRSSNIVILGGGAAGISSAYELARNEYKSITLERWKKVGGLAKTLDFGEWRSDIGPHRFFSKNQFLYDMIEEVLKEDWILVNRFTRFYIQGKFYMYPVQMAEALKNMGIFKAGFAFLDYLASRIRKKLLNPPVRNFEDFAILEFGKALAELNMLNYTEKIWGLPCKEISAEWGTQRIHGLSLMAIIKKAIFKGNEGPKTLVDTFYYPDKGASQTYEVMAEMTEQKGSVIQPNSDICEIHHEDGKITAVVVAKSDGTREKHPCDFCISSIPITEVVNMLRPAAPKELIEAVKMLKYRYQVYLFMKINKERVSKDNWIYFPDKEIPFGRIHEPKNFSLSMSPKDKTSLWVEHFVFPDDPRWSCSADDLYEQTIDWLEKLNFVNRSEVIEYYKHREDFVYPVYDLIYTKPLQTIKDYLKTFSNLQLIGRAGRFRYNNQDHSIETGVLAARNIIENGEYDLEKVGAEQEYFETGYLKTEKGYFKVENEAERDLAADPGKKFG
jgi:protoporphyrinogen oxidase